jgi:hypothetical protein
MRASLKVGDAVFPDKEEVTGSNPVRPTYCDLMFLVSGPIADAIRGILLERVGGAALVLDRDPALLGERPAYHHGLPEIVLGE